MKKNVYLCVLNEPFTVLIRYQYKYITIILTR